MWFSSLLHEDIEEREREQEREEQSDSFVCTKLCSRAMLVLSEHVYDM